MASKKGQHMVKKTNTCINVYWFLSIQVQTQLNLGFKCIAFNACSSHFYLFFF